MAAHKKSSSHNVEFAKGGNTKMFGQQSAEPMPSGVTRDPNAQDSKGDKFAKGGSGKMFGYNGAVAATAGITGAR